MQWDHVTATQNDDAFFEDYLGLALSCEPPELPPRLQHIGKVAAGWFPTLPRTAHIFAEGGNAQDRLFARRLVEAQLEGHGIQAARYTLDWDLSDKQLIKEADWNDIQAKAARLIKTGKVKITNNGAEIVTGVVEGDHGTYNTEIQRQDPNSQAISMWSCECKWDQFAWQRTRQWKRLEGRVCSHVLATYWYAQALPVEQAIPEDWKEEPAQSPWVQEHAPENLPQPQAPSSSPFGQMGEGSGMVPPMGYGLQKPGEPNAQAPMPEPSAPPPGQPPELIPQYPQDPALLPAINPISVPGQKPQTPLNPIQNPGGTFSHVAAQEFTNGQVVQLKNETVGTTEGLNAGAQESIPAGSQGEVRGMDLGLVQVLFPRHEAGPLEPHSTSAWLWPNELIVPDPPIQQPGTAIRRRR